VQDVGTAGGPRSRDPHAADQKVRRLFRRRPSLGRRILAWGCQERFNAETTFQFLEMLQAFGANGKKKVVLIDNARYHHAVLFKDWLEEVQDDFVLLHLPPYSPGFNPIERVWKLTRRLRTHNRLFADLGELSGRLDRQFAEWHDGSEVLRRL